MRKLGPGAGRGGSGRGVAPSSGACGNGRGMLSAALGPLGKGPVTGRIRSGGKMFLAASGLAYSRRSSCSHEQKCVFSTSPRFSILQREGAVGPARRKAALAAIGPTRARNAHGPPVSRRGGSRGPGGGSKPGLELLPDSICAWFHAAAGGRTLRKALATQKDDEASWLPRGPPSKKEDLPPRPPELTARSARRGGPVHGGQRRMSCAGGTCAAPLPLLPLSSVHMAVGEGFGR